jgi:hypothetical protein
MEAMNMESKLISSFPRTSWKKKKADQQASGKCLMYLSLSERVLVELLRPSALRKRLMHFPFEIIIWDTKVF